MNDKLAQFEFTLNVDRNTTQHLKETLEGWELPHFPYLAPL